MNDISDVLLWLPDAMFDAYRAAPWLVLGVLAIWPLIMAGLLRWQVSRVTAAILLQPWLVLAAFQFYPQADLFGLEMIGLGWPWWG